MKRFIRYLYEYEQDKRLRNVGFVKAEQDDRECVLHIHGKGLNLQEEKSLRVYLFFTEEGACFGIWQGDAQNVNPAINYRLYYTDQDVGGKEQFARIGGVILEAAGGRKFAAVWDDEAVNIGGMRVYTEERREQEIPAGEEADEQEIPAGEGADAQEIPAGEEADAQEQDMEVADQDRPGGFLCTKIQRKDLARLPRCEWKLSNNSFLLHGYYNYHHLVFLDDGEWLRVGVPGIYHPKEQKAAEAFGFSEFIRRRDIAVELEKEEREEDDGFGYWCRCVRRQRPGI